VWDTHATHTSASHGDALQPSSVLCLSCVGPRRLPRSELRSTAVVCGNRGEAIRTHSSWLGLGRDQDHDNDHHDDHGGQGTGTPYLEGSVSVRRARDCTPYLERMIVLGRACRVSAIALQERRLGPLRAELKHFPPR
jgi:hypothetical protein